MILSWKTKNFQGSKKKFKDEELEALLTDDCCQIQRDFAESLGTTQTANPFKSSRIHLKAMKIVCHTNWSQVTQKDEFACQKCCYKKKLFLHRIVTGDDNGSIKATLNTKNVKQRQLVKSTANSNIHDVKLCAALYFVNLEGRAVL